MIGLPPLKIKKCVAPRKKSHALKNAGTLFQKVATHFLIHNTNFSLMSMTKQECTLFTIAYLISEEILICI